MLNIQGFKYLVVIFSVVFSFFSIGLSHYAIAGKEANIKIAIASTGPTLDDAVADRFGRCPYFLIITTGNMEFEALQNPFTFGGGAGHQSAQLMVDKNVEILLTGNCGPNPGRIFKAAGVKVITGVSGSVRQAVEQYISGALR
jgi:predicted Fe-Mo cluster-binding NifX family protein